VPKDKIKISGSWLAWADNVRLGQLVKADGESSPVLLRSLADAPDGAQLRRDGRLLATIDHPRVLRLRHIAKASGRPLCVYEGFECVSMARVLQVLGVQGEFLPIRTCVELVAAAAEGLEAAMDTVLPAEGPRVPEVYHPGIAPLEVLVDATGQVKVAGLRVRRVGGESEEGPTGSRPPEWSTDEATAVYGLGALLVHFLSGEAPAAGSAEPERQRSIVRRALIRVLSRPGEAAADPVIDLIRDCMDSEAESRPTLSGLRERLDELNSSTSDASLPEWAPVKLDRILRQQEEGFPSEEVDRKHRYVDATSLHSDEPSSEAPPIRRSPREVATVLAAPGEGLSLAVGNVVREQASVLTGETEPARLARDVMPSMDPSLSLPIPESVLGTPGVPGVGIDRQSKPLVGSVPMDIRSDEWSPLDSPTQARKSFGWIMVGGVFAGMVVASMVAWVVMDRLAGPSLLSSGAETVDQHEAMQAGAAADEMAQGQAASEEEAGAPVVPADEPAQTDEPEAGPPVEELLPPVQEGPPVVPPSAAPAVQVTPEPPPVKAPRPAARVKPGSGPSDRFAVSFRSADPSVTLLEVRCHIGRGQGSGTVKIADAGPGPCKVIGHREGKDKLIVSAVLTGSRTFSCFAGGQRSCD
jgi:hypothetical protein